MDPRLANAKDFFAELTAELLACLRFCTRLPIPALAFEKAPHEMPIGACARMLPIAGAVIGTIAALVLWVAAKLGLPPSLAALFGISCLVLLTGALHEDGLADFADGTAGTTPEQRLAIMKDSRIGGFGTLALILSSLARVLSVAIIAAHSLCLACWVLIATAAVSRTLMLLALHLLPPARTEGAGFAAAAPQEPVLAIAALIGFILGLLPLLAGAGIGRVAIGLILSIAAAYGVTALARRLLQGQTGDVAGATQQAAEIAAYLVYAAWL
ncbi:MAG TPA: adenosylcobinamide-GDP ribazoletransferase [Methylovirgula sp.]|nr:adenosylcobinamide-GDP ribazoletransferase [Methylovirgula sp.]